MRAVVVTCLALAALAAGVPTATAAPPKLTEVLQYSAPAGAGGSADSAPRGLVRSLRALGLSPRGFEALPMIVVRGTPEQIRRARELPGVRYHHSGNPRVVFDLERSVPLVFRGPPAPVRAAAGDARGVRVAVLDTGVDGLHPHLGPRVVHNVAFATTEAVAGGVILPLLYEPVVCPSACSTDVDGHGTHVSGIVAGMGRGGGSHAGVAPGAEIVSVAITQSGRYLEALTGIDYVLAHPELRIKVVNNSWHIPGQGFDPTDPINQATKRLHDAGITVVFSAGNSGQGTPAPGQPRGSSDCIERASSNCAISLQGSAPWTVMVAAGDAVAPGGPEDQHLKSSSSRGDPRPYRVGGVDVEFMPTLTAPGTFIVSTAAGAAGAGRCLNVTCPGGLVDPQYALMGGTSMAVPHVVATAALLQSAAKERLGRELTPDEVKALLVKGAAPMRGPFDEPGTCDRYTGPATGCDPGMCSIVSEAMGCTPAKPTGRYARWQVGAGYLDVPGALRALDRMVRPSEPPPVTEAPPAPAAAAPPAVTGPALPSAAPTVAAPRKPAASKKRKASKKRAKSRKASKRRAKHKSKKRRATRRRR